MYHLWLCRRIVDLELSNERGVAVLLLLMMMVSMTTVIVVMDDDGGDYGVDDVGVHGDVADDHDDDDNEDIASRTM